MKKFLGATVLVLSLGIGGSAAAVDFSRGDANSDGTLNIADVIFMISYLFQGGPAPECLGAADVNDDGAIDIGDPIRLLSQSFHGFFADLPPQFCGADPTPDNLDCPSFAPCPE